MIGFNKDIKFCLKLLFIKSFRRCDQLAGIIDTLNIKIKMFKFSCSHAITSVFEYCLLSDKNEKLCSGVTINK